MDITTVGRWLAIGGVVAVGGSLAACNTTKATLDTTVAFFSSTSPQDIFSADGLVRQEQKINLFAGVAYENLRQEVASGGGQYVTSLATLYGVPETKHADFARLLQQHHGDLFVVGLQEDKTAHLQMVKRLNQVLLADASMVR
jgi:hypothetical protein